MNFEVSHSLLNDNCLQPIATHVVSQHFPGCLLQGTFYRVARLLIFHLRTRKLMQHHLHHGELVQVGVEQTGDDHGVLSLAAEAARCCGAV